MNLLHATRTALDLTARLAEALAAEDIDLCRRLLAERAEAMRDFETCHRRATTAELQESQALVHELIASDCRLLHQAEQGLLATAEIFRAGLGNRGPATNAAYRHEPHQACVDRKA